MYICITEIDAVTKIVCTAEPQRTGPSMPAVKGYTHLWHDSSTYPSWIGYTDTMTWSAPVARPVDAIMNGGNVRYQWDEATVNWVAQA